MRLTGLFDGHITQEVRTELTLLAGRFPTKWGEQSLPPGVDGSVPPGPIQREHKSTAVVEFEVDLEAAKRIAGIIKEAGGRILVDGHDIDAPLPSALQELPDGGIVQETLPIVDLSMEASSESQNDGLGTDTNQLPQPEPDPHQTVGEQLKDWLKRLTPTGKVQ